MNLVVPVLIGLFCGMIPLQVNGAGAPFALKNDVFNDPEIGVQRWVFDMINVWPVWEQGIFGTGVRVRINDEGVDSQHEEFEGRFDADASCQVYDISYDKKKKEFGQHGTIVASIIGAAGNNGQCAVGVAPEVVFSSCVILSAPDVDETSHDGTYPAYKLDQIDISQNSFGVQTCRALENSTFEGTFPNINTCPFTYKYGDTVPFFGQAKNITHPCKACEFPSTQPDVFCANVVDQHCLLFAEFDHEICMELLDKLVLGGQCGFRPMNPVTTAAIEQGAMKGRDGKGIIYVHSSGNDLGLAGNTNFQQPSRFPIFVGAVGKDAMSTSYSAPGASLLLTAPGGDISDLTHQAAAYAGGGCQLANVGTSFSSPIVSGVVALMLEANPNLTWRDVQGILAITSRPVTHANFEDDTQTTNGAGLTHSNLYGFGIVDAFGAVTAAQNWLLYGEEQILTAIDSNMNISIGDNPNAPLVAELSIESMEPLIQVENVEVNLYIQHLSRGHLKVTLTSPDGTVSELTPGAVPENGQESGPWTLRTIRSWGEIASGTWTLTISDVTQGDVSKCADLMDWQVDVKDVGPIDCGMLEYFEGMHDESYVSAMSHILDRITAGCCSCGGGSLAGSICSDFYSASSLCEDAERRQWCADGGLTDGTFPSLFMLEDEQGRRPKDACCVLGGGTKYTNPADYQDQLLGWELKVYGHEKIITPVPTDRPSSMPSSTLSLPSEPLFPRQKQVPPTSGSVSQTLYTVASTLLMITCVIF
ncbi:unnamed protein product [Cylindrotheca closterium]|uniref:subtilisin n=1 Tax=Cylindrotheca closterium TaxID=2856 RepID=A0AAD2G511_9STRA|nr:unnamed protein product [Cylindrotheca closterium]